jgi:hypothetical protein
MIDTSLIPKPENKEKVISKNGNTQSIIDSILSIDRKYNCKPFKKFAKQFEGEKGLKRLWSFCKYQIQYKKDSFDTSQQLTPPALWSRGFGDCKSKTLFINCILRCLKIPYIIRFTNYRRGEKNVKHVYTVAIINGLELPIDSVYNVYGKEKKYNKKIDYPMTEIIEISGFGSSVSKKKSKDRITNQAIIPQPDLVKKLEEVKQKQRYVTEQEEIRFSKISEGIAMLKIAERELQVIGTMQPQKKKDAEIGINLIRRALKGDFSASRGNIPKSLAGTIAKIKTAENWNKIPANNFGFMEKQIHEIKKQEKKRLNKANIGAINFPQRVCLNNALWYLALPNDIQNTNTFPDKIYSKPSFNYLPNDEIDKNHDGWGGICKRKVGDWKFRNSDYFLGALNKEYYTNPSYTNRAKFGDYVFFHYGRESEYRQTYNQSYTPVNIEFDKLINENIMQGPHTWSPAWTYQDMVANQNYGRYSVAIQSQSDYEIAMERLNGASGVLDAYINDIFRADNTVNGTMGSGLIYSFLSNTGKPMNSFPNATLTKMGFQEQFIDSTQFFSNISRNSIMGMARNGILFDNAGEQPEQTLKYLLSIYDGTNSNINAVCAGACIALVTAIIAAIVTLTTKIIDAVAQGNKASQEASKIDSYAKDQANFQPLGMSKMLNENDWLPEQFKGEEGKKNIALFLGAIGLGAYALTQDKK